MKVILVEQNLIDTTSEFAQDVFIDYYTDLIGKQQSLYMANLFLSKQAIAELINKGAIFKLVMENDKPIAFFEYVLEEKKVFLSKLYVRKDYRKKGVSRLMLDDCIKYAKQNNRNAIYLTVNKGNTNSIEVYNHYGFKEIDAVVNDIGNGYVMDDYIMELKIKNKKS